VTAHDSHTEELERGRQAVRYRIPGYATAGVLASAVAAILGYWQKTPCSSGGAWNSFTGQFRAACYTDVYPLYYDEGLASGRVPYYGHIPPGQHPVEYPVLTGALMQLASWAVHSVSDVTARGRDFYYVTVVLLALCLMVGVVATASAASREGRDAGRNAALLVAFSPGLILAAFLALNKVWSPQYVIWLVPLAVLARPRMWSYVVWQLAEVAYFFGIWGYFVFLYRTAGATGYAGVSPGWYFVIMAARLLALGLLAATVLQDIYRPERDRVRAGGVNDDPAGGVLDGATDRWVIVWQRRGEPHAADAMSG
jgi:hypothetical protein